MKSIFINGRFLARRPTGVDRYAIESIKAIESLIQEGNAAACSYEWTILAPKGAPKPDYIKTIKFKNIKPFSGTLWEQLTLPAYSIGSKLINLCNSAPILKKNQLVVIHDATTKRVPEAFSKNFVRWYNFIIPILLKRAEVVATVSNFSEREIKACYKIDRRILVFQEGADHFQKINATPNIMARFNLKRPYILAVGSLAPHKNFKTLISAIEQLNEPAFDCVIAGGTDPKIFASDKKPLPKWVMHVGYVSDEELKALYENASLFVFPSTYEGYGLPPTEAMASGCPVLSSNTASMPEICGDAAYYFSPNDEMQLARMLNELAADHEQRNSMKLRGLQQSAALLWRNGALNILSAINDGQI